VRTGNSKINSTSKIINTKVTRKNCTESREREEFLFLNPHSKGLAFSSWTALLRLKTAPARDKTPPKSKATSKTLSNIRIKSL
jgi:hypothetical protein